MTDERPRVLWLIKGLGPGGAERLLVHHARLADHDRFAYEAAYVVPVKSHHVADLTDAGVTVHGPPPGGASPRAWPRWLGSLLAERRPAVVHTHSPALAPLARTFTRVPGAHRAAHVYTEHNSLSIYRPATRALDAATMRLDRHVWAVSADVRRSIGRVWRHQVEVLHHGVDLDAVRAAATADVRAELGIGDDEVVVTMVANLRPQKDHANALDAVERLAPDGPPTRLLLVGQGPLLDDVRRDVARRRLDDRVLVLGQRDDVPAVLAASDLLLLASRQEGLPVAVMEAFALGLPVVSTAVGGVPEAVRDGIEGFLVPPKDPVALAAAMDRLRCDVGLRARLGRSSADRATAFDAARAVARVEAVYGALASGAPVPDPAI